MTKANGHNDDCHCAWCDGLAPPPLNENRPAAMAGTPKMQPSFEYCTYPAVARGDSCVLLRQRCDDCGKLRRCRDGHDVADACECKEAKPNDAPQAPNHEVLCTHVVGHDDDGHVRYCSRKRERCIRCGNWRRCEQGHGAGYTCKCEEVKVPGRTSVEQQGADLQAAKAETSDLAERVAELESLVAHLTEDQTWARMKLGIHKTRIDDLEASIGKLQAKSAEDVRKIVGQGPNDRPLGDVQNELLGWVMDLGGNVGTLQLQVAALEAKPDALMDRIVKLEADNNETDKRLLHALHKRQDLNARIKALEAKSAETEGRIVKLEKQVVSLELGATHAECIRVELLGNVSGLRKRLGALESQLAKPCDGCAALQDHAPEPETGAVTEADLEALCVEAGLPAEPVGKLPEKQWGLWCRITDKVRHQQASPTNSGFIFERAECAAILAIHRAHQDLRIEVKRLQAIEAQRLTPEPEPMPEPAGVTERQLDAIRALVGWIDEAPQGGDNYWLSRRDDECLGPSIKALLDAYESLSTEHAKCQTLKAATFQQLLDSAGASAAHTLWDRLNTMCKRSEVYLLDLPAPTTPPPAETPSE